MTSHRDGDVQLMTVQHCDRLHDSLQTTLVQQFSGLHQRLEDLAEQVRATNGRLRQVETDVATITVRNDERWRNHDRATPERLDGVSITRREVQIVLVTLGAIGTVLATLRWLWPALHRAFMGP